jgi:hypothetical protein
MDPSFYCNGDFNNKVFEAEACHQINQCEISNPFNLTLADGFTLTAQL